MTGRNVMHNYRISTRIVRDMRSVGDMHGCGCPQRQMGTGRWPECSKEATKALTVIKQ